MYKTLVKNYISRDGIEFKCHRCRQSVPSNNFVAVTEHTNSPNHKELVSKYQNKIESHKTKEFPQSEAECKLIVENNVVFERTFYFCKLCTSKVPTFRSLLAHMKGDAHQTFYLVFNKPQIADECYNAQIGLIREQNPSDSKDEINDTQSPVEYDLTRKYTIMVDNCISRSKDQYNCFLCRTQFPADNFNTIIDHINSPPHKLSTKAYKKNKSFMNESEDNVEDDTEESCKLLVDNNVVYKGLYYFCVFCRASMSLNSLHQHINGRKHQNYYSVLNLPYVNDDLMMEEINSDERENEVKENAASSNINPANNIQDSNVTYKFLVQNFLTKLESAYKCHVCNCTIDTDLKNLLEHVKTPHHQDFCELYAWDRVRPNKSLVKVISQTEEEYKFLVENYIIFKGTIFHCCACNCKKFDHSVIDSHIYSVNHINKCLLYGKNYKRPPSRSVLRKQANIEHQDKENVQDPNKDNIQDQNTDNIEDENKEIIQDQNTECIQDENKENIKVNELVPDQENEASNQTNTAIDLRFLNELFYKELRDNQIFLKKPRGEFECLICRIYMSDLMKAYEHTVDEVHRKNIQRLRIKTDNIESILHNVNNPDLFYHCKKCDVYLTINQTLLQSHCMIHLHEDYPELNHDILKFDISEGKCVSIKCVLCQVFLVCDKTLAEHLDSLKHRQKYDFINCLVRRRLKLNIAGMPKTVTSGSTNVNSFKPLDEISFKSLCEICYEPVAYKGRDKLQVIRAKENLQVQAHEHRQDPLIGSLEKHIHFYKCLLCNYSVTHSKTLLDHYRNKLTHGKFLEKLYTIINEKNLNYILPLDFIQIYKLLHSLDKSYRFVRERIISILKPLAPIKDKTPREKKSRKNILVHESMSDFIDTYVEMCISPGQENIYKIDFDLIERNNLGISLMFPGEKKRVCFACSYVFSGDYLSLYEHLLHETHIDNLDSLIEEDEEKEKDSLSYFDLAKSCMQEISPEVIKCHACNKEIDNYDDEILTHMESSDHKHKIDFWKIKIEPIMDEFEKLVHDSWYYIERYFCQVCNLTCNHEMSFAKHLKSTDHLKKRESSTTETKLNVCHACRCCWYGKPNYKEHFENLIHVVGLKKRHYSLIPSMRKQSENLLYSAERNIQMLLKDSDKVTNSKQEIDKEDEVLDDVEQIVRCYYSQAKAYSFGSRSCHLGFPTSDVDIFVDCEGIYENIGSRVKSQKYIQKVQRHFFKSGTWRKDCVLLEARVPIMKLIHRPTNLKCDISFLSGLGVEKSNLIRNYVLSFKECRKLILFLKQWFTICDLYGPQFINAYAIAWYAIFYLQLQGIVPSVFELIKMKNRPRLVDGWQCGFLEPVPVNVNNYNLESLLKGFFHYYSEFNFQTDVACPFLGKALSKSTFKNINHYPEEMKIYKDRLTSKEEEPTEIFRFESPMCIQDPVDLSQNITKAVRKADLRCFKTYCFESFKILSKR